LEGGLEGGRRSSMDMLVPTGGPFKWFQEKVKCTKFQRPGGHPVQKSQKSLNWSEGGEEKKTAGFNSKNGRVV